MPTERENRERIKELARIVEEQDPSKMDPLRYRDAVWKLGKMKHPQAIPLLIKAHAITGTRLWAEYLLGIKANELQKQPIHAKEEKALLVVWRHFRENEEQRIVQKAYEAALEGKITPKNAALYVKQLRAVQGILK